MKEKEIIKFLIPYLNIHDFPKLPGIVVGEEAQALIYNLEMSELKAKLDEYQENAKNAAFKLLKEEDIANNVNNLPFKDGQSVYIVGDNSTDEKRGWVDIFKYLINLGTDNEINIFNKACSGDTSLDILKNLGQNILANQPDWIILSFGTWDAFRPNYATDRPLVSVTEFWENVNSIKTALESLKTKNPVIWLAPSLVNEEMANAYPFFNGSFNNSEIRAYQEIIRDKGGIIVDPYFMRFGKDMEAWQFAPDGVHFSLSGNIETVKVLIKTLADYNKKGS